MRHIALTFTCPSGISLRSGFSAAFPWCSPGVFRAITDGVSDGDPDGDSGGDPGGASEEIAGLTPGGPTVFPTVFARFCTVLFQDTRQVFA
jgi:hypothetical protein